MTKTDVPDLTRRKDAAAAQDFRDLRYPRPCKVCGRRQPTSSVYWHHWFSVHGGLGKP